jgi:hypothetical protein
MQEEKVNGKLVYILAIIVFSALLAWYFLPLLSTTTPTAVSPPADAPALPAAPKQPESPAETPAQPATP